MISVGGFSKTTQMKTAVLFLVFALPALAQTGFKTERGKIVWERFFPASGADIKSIIESHENIKLEDSNDVAFTGKAEAIKNEIYANSVRLESDANFDFSVTRVEGGCKVRVTNYVFLEKYGPSQMRILPGSLEKYYLEHGRIRNSEKTSTDLAYIDGFLSSVFTQRASANATATTARPAAAPGPTKAK